MEALNDYNYVLFVIVQVSLMFFISAFISGIRYKKSDYIYIIGIVLSSVYFFDKIGSISLVVITIFIIIFLYFKIRLYSVFLVMVTQIILYCANFVYIIIFSYIITISHSVFIVLPISLLFAYSQIDASDASTIKQYSILFLGIIILLSILIFIYSQFTLKEMKYKRNQEEIETYYEYTLKIEAINNEMRKFRHDYVNILTTLSEYIREDDMTGLRDYFNKNIVPMKDNLQMNALKLNGIENLKVREIKGLLTAKILRAQEMNIPISIEIPDEVTRINLNMIDLSRSIGIILDNAIEASSEIDDPIIRVAFIESENSVTFIVMNKCADDIPRIHELFQESFSTKGEGRGLGLSTLKEIADNADNVLLDTIIENGFFIQKVEIINN
ncbi:TPA: GHKL domain-containing protein [Staphylococcus aureus]|nr:GHKL domain-containing protein [Staphylococcus aureus]